MFENMKPISASARSWRMNLFASSIATSGFWRSSSISTLVGRPPTRLFR